MGIWDWRTCSLYSAINRRPCHLGLLAQQPDGSDTLGIPGADLDIKIFDNLHVRICVAAGVNGRPEAGGLAPVVSIAADYRHMRQACNVIEAGLPALNFLASAFGGQHERE